MANLKSSPQPSGIDESLITFLCYRSTIRSDTRLAKLLYLVDLYYAEIYGKPLSGIQHKRFWYGPWSPDIPKLKEMLLAKGVIRETKKTTLGGYQAKVPMPARRSVNVFLTTQAIDIIEAVLSDWNDKPTNEIVKYVKTRPPFIMASFDESIDFTKGDPIIALASKRNLNPEDMATELIRSSPDLLKISLQAIQEEKEHQFASQTEIEKLGLPV